MRIAFAVILLVAGIVVGAWDIWVTAIGRPLDTVSRTLWDWSTMYPILPFVFGVIIGHVFWPTIILWPPGNQPARPD